MPWKERRGGEAVSTEIYIVEKEDEKMFTGPSPFFQVFFPFFGRSICRSPDISRKKTYFALEFRVFCFFPPTLWSLASSPHPTGLGGENVTELDGFKAPGTHMCL